MRSLRTLVCLGAVLLGVSAPAQAQEPDVRDIPPLVMLVVDSSGSMEDLPGCKCTSDTDCTNCEPGCHLPNTFNEPPKDSAGHELKKNRWAVTLEALTGKFKNFECTPLVRNAANGFTGYDEGYSVPYNQPWKCSSGTRCDYPGPAIQEFNGILDNYRDTLRFGLVTFDGERTYKGGSDLINAANFNDALSNGVQGMWSYHDKKKVRYPGCPEEYWVNSGVRSSTASEGALISLNSTNCASPPCDIYELNDTIQTALLRTRPYSGTPIAASLDDLYAHLKNEVSSDAYAECRKRYGILITDGAPDEDFRDLGCDCEDENPMVDCDDDPRPPLMPGETNEFECPYPLAADAAKKLISEKQLEQLFVLGMSVQDTGAMATLNDIAAAGGTTKALAADDPNTLRATLDNVFGPLLNPVSRSVPAFATGVTGVQYQVSSGFQVSASSSASVAPSWVGLIERRKFICNATTGEIVSPDLEDADRFHKVLSTQASDGRRVLQTAVPPGSTAFTSATLSNLLVKGDTGDEHCGLTGCELRDLTHTSLTRAIYNVSTDDDRTALLSWMYAGNSSPRQGRALGDIYHGSPALVGPPKDEPADDAYTRFRDRPVVKERPLMMYITSNDGILHAFSVEDYPATGFPITVHASHGSLPMRGGHELWGFVPPMLLENLKDQQSAHKFNLDGTPVVKDVFFKRGTSAADTDYHTVLISGMRGGGRGYFAMDVTDPFEPKFLWQYTDKDMGLTYGQPEIVQATFKFAATSSETETVQTRAVAILPGGVGNRAATADASIGCDSSMEMSAMPTPGGELYTSFTKDPATTSGATLEKHRKVVQCWERQGRALYFVDIETGKLIKKVFDKDGAPDNGIMFPSPVSGTPTAYQDAVATIADRGYVLDADGVLWRFDMSSQDPDFEHGDKGWTVRPFHDLYWDKAVKDGGETTYERPILSLDRNRRVVVIVGTGDTDNFEKSAADNRIVSLTEVSTVAAPSKPDDYQALINWELRNEGLDATAEYLVPSELVTGSMALFEGQLFAATFVSKVGTSDACEYGRGRLWSLSYVDADKSHENRKWGGSASTGDKAGTFAPLRIPVVEESGSTEDSDGELFNIPLSAARPNLLIQGLGTTQRLTCSVPDPDPLNSYFAPALTNIEQSQEPAIWVVAQASKGDKRANSKLGSIQTKVKRPITFSRITSWAASID